MTAVDTRRRFVKPPSVQDYARMSAKVRTEWFRLVSEQLQAIERRRQTLEAKPPVRRADDYHPDETRELAKFLLVRYQRTYNDTDTDRAERQSILADAAGPGNQNKRRAS